MKKISKKEISKMVKRAYKEAREFCNYDYFRCYNMMLDTDDGKIWSDVFLDTNSWKEYHSTSVIRLSHNSQLVKEIEQDYINDAVKQLTRAGWEIEN